MRFASLAFVPLLAPALPFSPAAAEPRFPPPPAPGDVVLVLEEALSLASPDLAAVRQTSARLLAEHGAVLRVLVLDSIGAHGASAAEGWSVPFFARAVAWRWASDPAAAAAAAASPVTLAAGRDLLLLVALADRRLAIEAGAHWLPRSAALRRAGEVAAYHLERGTASRAIAEGVQAIEAAVRGRAIAPPGGHLEILLFLGFFGLVFLSIISYLRSREESVAARVWGAIFSAAGLLLGAALERGALLGGGGAKNEAASARGGISTGSW
jgi:uncharacterized membrane protein YgcG